MKALISASFIALAAAGLAGGAKAAMIVHDPTSYAKLVQQTKTALDQLGELKRGVEQGERLLKSLNEGSPIQAIASTLAQPGLRRALPDLSDLQSLLETPGTSAGKLSARIAEIRRAERLLSAEAAKASPQLEAAGLNAARDLAIAETVVQTSTERLAGLNELEEAIAAAGDARAVLDLQARLAAEQALIANDQMRLQGIAIAQLAEAKLEAQRDRERMVMAREARQALYRRSF